MEKTAGIHHSYNHYVHMQCLGSVLKGLQLLLGESHHVWVWYGTLRSLGSVYDWGPVLCPSKGYEDRSLESVSAL